MSCRNCECEDCCAEFQPCWLCGVEGHVCDDFYGPELPPQYEPTRKRGTIDLLLEMFSEIYAREAYRLLEPLNRVAFDKLTVDPNCPPNTVYAVEGLAAWIPPTPE